MWNFYEVCLLKTFTRRTHWKLTTFLFTLRLQGIIQIIYDPVLLRGKFCEMQPLFSPLLLKMKAWSQWRWCLYVDSVYLSPLASFLPWMSINKSELRRNMMLLVTYLKQKQDNFCSWVLAIYTYLKFTEKFCYLKFERPWHWSIFLYFS